MTGDFTGDDWTGPAAQNSGPVYIQHTKVSEARCSGYDIPRDRSAVERATRHVLPKGRKPAAETAAEPELARRQAVRQHLARAQKLADEMVAAAGLGDAYQLAISGMDLATELDALWTNRSVREEDWADALNFLQAAIRREEFERFTVQQCETVREGVVQCLAGGLVDPEDVTRLRVALRQSGLDPWKAISGTSE